MALVVLVLDEVGGDEEKWTLIIRTLRIYLLIANMDLTGSLAAYEGVVMCRPCSITVPWGGKRADQVYLPRHSHLTWCKIPLQDFWNVVSVWGFSIISVGGGGS